MNEQELLANLITDDNIDLEPILKLFESVLSKRKINNAIIEHRLYEHFGFCESITVKFA
jgi:uncharacterized protein YajQ (UPF0234 family)